MSNEAQTVAIVSLGCPKNLVDSEKLCSHLAEAGYLIGAPMEEADVILINTCGFLQSAREESLEIIAEAVTCKQTGNARRVVVAGCLVNRDGQALLSSIDGIDAIVSVNDRDAIVQAVQADARQTLLSDAGPAGDDRGRFRLTSPHTAFLRIAEGCDHRCTFCTIPDIRGPFRSKPLDRVLAEAKELVESGAVELNVIAQDTTSYGMDLPDKPTLATLLTELNKLEGVSWIRLMYAYPNNFTDELIDVMTTSDRIVEYVDMPLQHISDGVLKRMGRRITRVEIETLLAKLRDAMPNMTLRTTLIAGFPGETDEQFAELLTFVEEFEFDAMGAFAYSPEEGTPATTLPDQVSEDVKLQRVEQLMLAQQAIVFDTNDAVLGQLVDVLVDGVDNEGVAIARHSGQAPEIDSVCLLTGPAPVGEIVPAEIVDWQDYDLIVQPVSQVEG
jgi:ribosomal protein S12 methylthiotransferase